MNDLEKQIAELTDALRPFVEFHNGGEVWKETVWEHKDDSAAVMHDSRSGRNITIADFWRAQHATRK